ncbi:conserved phage C-terminal domain-containing protein [Campylobacter sp. MOP7]|uniref:conserved phage C-terminal domain-containing protein n=1 Tax=Campylobacter canis TaxID=3378588 RepID=UPI00387E74A6
MKVDGNSVKALIEYQLKNHIADNNLLLFALAINTGNATLVKTMQELLNLNPEEIDGYFKVYNEKELMQKKDLALYDKLAKVKVGSVVDYSKEVEVVISHLAQLKNTKIEATKDRSRLISKHLMSGFTVEECLMVNLHFFTMWSCKPDFAMYLRIETLYNGKFPSRVEMAKEQFQKVNKFKSEISKVVHCYTDVYNQFVLGCKVDLSKSNPVLYTNFETQKTIAHWLNAGILVDDICLVVKNAVQSWSKNVNYLANITLDKVIDKDFMKRLDVVRRQANLRLKGDPQEREANKISVASVLKDKQENINKTLIRQNETIEIEISQDNLPDSSEWLKINDNPTDDFVFIDRVLKNMKDINSVFFELDNIGDDYEAQESSKIYTYGEYESQKIGA